MINVDLSGSATVARMIAANYFFRDPSMTPVVRDAS